MTKSNSKKIRELQNIEKNSTSEDEIGLLKKENEYLKIEWLISGRIPKTRHSISCLIFN